MERKFHSKVVGVTANNKNGRNRQEIIRKCVEINTALELVREPKNPYDKNAIAVYVTPKKDPWGEKDYQIGYLSRELAEELAPIMDGGEYIVCLAVEITGGADGKSFGVNILLTFEDRVNDGDDENEEDENDDDPFETLSIKETRTRVPVKSLPDKKPKPKHVTPSSDKSSTTALILCVFLGIFGAHYFYVGRIGKGLVYLFTAGLVGIGWLIDIFVILSGSFRDNVGMPLRQ